MNSTITVVSLPATPFAVLPVGAGVQGPRGPVGPAGGAASQFIADTALGGGRLVAVTNTGGVEYADSSTLAHIGKVAGITVGAAVMGDPVTVISSGPIVEPAWSWTPDLPVFLGHNGLLTQSAPDGSFQLVVGVALTATSIFVRFREPLIINP